MLQIIPRLAKCAGPKGFIECRCNNLVDKGDLFCNSGFAFIYEQTDMRLGIGLADEFINWSTQKKPTHPIIRGDQNLLSRFKIGKEIEWFFLLGGITMPSQGNPV
ncbi:MAG: hypothetical protein HN611_05755 [Gemmatimonadetes bacterium]|nr:hypothetical protein [Gemmatimonadota bacterium]